MGLGGARRLWETVAPARPLYRDAHYLAADVELDPHRARPLVPSPLVLAPGRDAVVFAAWFPDTSFGSVYREVGVFLPVRHGRTEAVFCPWMLVDDDVALIAGRELLGYPKKLGEVAFTHEGDRIEATARRRGVELLRFCGAVGAPLSAPPPMLGRPHRNVRSTLGLALPKLLAFHPRETVREVRAVELTLAIGGSPRDPLDTMGLGPVRSARLHRVDLRSGGLPVPVAPVSPLWLAEHALLRGH